jgi:uncharacterized membrane protein
VTTSDRRARGRPPGDRRVETRARQERVAALVAGWGLRVGAGVAVCLLAVGLVLQLASGRRGVPKLSLSALWTSATVPEQLMGAGVLVIAVTPGVVVALLAALWARQRDWRFAAVAVVVLGVLAAAYFSGGG